MYINYYLKKNNSVVLNMLQTLVFFPAIYCIAKLCTHLYNDYKQHIEYEAYNDEKHIISYDTHEIPCIIMRLFHGIGTIYITGSILYYDTQDLFFSHSSLTPDMKFALDYSLCYFLWDTFMTYIGNDPQKKLFIIHHVACIYLLIFSIFYEYEPKDLLVCIFFSEITNPIYQINDLLLFLHLKNINHIFIIGSINFVCTYLIRGILYPHLFFVWYHSYTTKIYIYQKSISYILFIYSFGIISLGFIIGSYYWLYHKYQYLITYYH